MSDYPLFVVFPYVALLLLLIGTPLRYFLNEGGRGKLANAFLTSKALFWGPLPLRIGILGLAGAFVVDLAFARQLVQWGGYSTRALLLDGAVLAFGISALAGLGMAFRQHLSDRDLREASRPADVIALTLLLAMIGSAVAIVVIYRWSSSWSSVTLVPYLHSIVRLEPRPELIAGLPFAVKLHIFSMFLLAAVAPFGHLCHLAAYPLYRAAAPLLDLLSSMGERAAELGRKGMLALSEWREQEFK